MKDFTFIKQDIFHIKNQAGDVMTRGNCLQASIASLLGLQLRDVPDFSLFFDSKRIHWASLMDDWLADQGYELVHAPEFKYLCHGIELTDADESFLNPDIPIEHYSVKDKVYEVSGKSPRGDFRHSCIYKDGLLYHDPHPSNDGVEPHSDLWPWSISQLIPIL
jgi:hypothetical protein